MKPLNFLFILLMVSAMGILVTGCWTDTQQYEDFVCERFGGDFDGDGVCSRNDCNDYDPTVYAGAPCDDGDEETINDTINEECDCVGV